MLKHLKKLATFRSFLIYFVVHAVILVAVVFSVIRLALPHIENKLPQIEEMVSQSFGVEIKLDSMRTGWRRLSPVLRFEGVTLLNKQTHEPIAQVHFFDVELDLFGSLRHWTLIPGHLTLDGVTLSIEQEPDGSFRLKNHLSTDERSKTEILKDLLTHFQRLSVKNGNLELFMNEGNPIYLHLDYMSFFPRKDAYRLETEISGKEIPAHLTLIADLKGELDDLEHSMIDGFLQLDHVSYDARFMPLKLYSIKPQAGNLDLNVWFEWENGQWQEMIGKIALHQVMLQNVNEPQNILPFNLQANIAWEAKGDNLWQLSGDKILLRLDAEESSPSSFILEGGSVEPWNLRLDTIALDDVIDILALSDQIDSKTRAAFHQLKANGQLHDLQWIGTPTDEGFKDWRLGIKLDELHWQAYDNIPAASHLSGELKLSEHQGILTLDSEDASLTLPELFEMPLNFDYVRGSLSWTNKNQWVLHSDEIRFITSDTEARAQLTLVVPEDSSKTTIDLSVTTDEFNQSVAKKYLPTKLLSHGLVQWINTSVENGRVSTMKTVVKGPLNLFPYKNGGGEYEMRFSLEDVDLHFHSAWPAVHHLTGDLVLDGKGLQAYVDSGTINGSSLSDSKVSLVYTQSPDPLILHISGLLKGDSEDAENFLRASPLWDKLGSIFDMVKIRGPLALNLKTDIPLRGPADSLKVEGSASLSDGTVTIDKWNLAFSEVKGDLQFTQKSVNSSGIQAIYQGKPGIISASTKTLDNLNEITWNYHSTLDKPFVEKFAKSNYWTYFDGSAEYDASFKVSIPKTEQPFELTLSSSLKGISLSLPDPLEKSADQSLPSSVTLTFLTPQTLHTEFHLGEHLIGLLNFNKNKTGYSLAQGQFIAGSEMVSTPMPASGISVTGHIPKLVIQDWTVFFANHHKKFPSKPTEISPEIIITDLHADDLQYKDWHLSNANISVRKTSDNWLIDLNSKEVEGALRFPLQSELAPMVFDLKRCAWPLGEVSANMSKLTPKDLNLMNLQCKSFKYKNTNIGSFHLGVTPQRDTNSVSFDPISLESKDDKLTAKGDWALENGVLVSHFKGDATSTNVGKSLRGWGIPTDVQDAKGDGKFDLKWPGSPSDFSKSGLSGELELRMQNGRFLGVNPGFGRMLGLLSFQSLSRRLRLDFSDLFKTGFAFDSFKSNISIDHGTASTVNTTLKAPAADLTITGHTGLVAQDLDFDMIVQAHIDSTVPAAAVAIANPAAGAAVWVFDKVFNPLGNMARYRYHITGTWEKPEFKDMTEQYRKELDGPAKVIEAQ